MPIALINNQVNQSAQPNQASSAKIPSITSNDPTILTQQEKTIQNQISQMQKQSGSSQQIQKLNQALQSIQQRLRQQAKAAVPQTANDQNSSSNKVFSKSFSIKI
jgi:hypothetical protein